MARKTVNTSHYKGSKGRAIHRKSSYIKGLIRVCLIGIKSRSACKCQRSCTTGKVRTCNCCFSFNYPCACVKIIGNADFSKK